MSIQLVGGERREKLRTIVEENQKRIGEAVSAGLNAQDVELVPVPDTLLFRQEIAPNGPASAEEVIGRFYDEYVPKPLPLEGSSEEEYNAVIAADRLRYINDKSLNPIGEVEPETMMDLVTRMAASR